MAGCPDRASVDLQVLHGVGMVGAVPTMIPPATPAYTSIQLDGKVAGYIPADRAGAVVARLRDLKAAALALHEPLPEGASVVPTNVSQQKPVRLPAVLA